MMAEDEPRSDASEGLSPALKASRQRAKARAAKKRSARQRQAEERHPLGPVWFWGLALTGSGFAPTCLLLLVVLGWPWSCRAAAAQGFLVVTLPLALIFGVIGALGFEELRERFRELLDLQAYRQRLPGVVTRSEFVERQLSIGGYSRYVTIDYDYEHRGKVRHGSESTTLASNGAMKRLVRRHPPGTVVELRQVPEEPKRVRLLFPGWATLTWLVARTASVVVLGSLLGGLCFAVVVAFTGT
jgi:hypothetical protein